MEDGEGECGVENHSCEAGDYSGVEAHPAAGGVYCAAYVHETFTCTVFLLHLGLDNINWIVSHNRNKSGKTTSEQVNNDLIAHIPAEELLGIGEDDETDSLVRALFHHGGYHTGVETLHTRLACNSVDALEDV